MIWSDLKGSDNIVVMPIVIEAVPLEKYIAWLSSQISPPHSSLHNPNKLHKLGKRLYSTSSSSTGFSTSSTVLTPLHPWYVTGLVLTPTAIGSIRKGCLCRLFQMTLISTWPLEELLTGRKLTVWTLPFRFITELILWLYGSSKASIPPTLTFQQSIVD